MNRVIYLPDIRMVVLENILYQNYNTIMMVSGW